MSSEYVGIEEARKRLGDLVTAAQQGADVTITRNGKPAARLVTAKEPAMRQISIRAHRPSDNPFSPDAYPPFAGTFTPETSQYWCGDGKPREAGGEYVDREGERLWQTGDGRWIVTQHGQAGNYAVTEVEAEQWFSDNGYSAEDRDLYIRSGHDA